MCNYFFVAAGWVVGNDFFGFSFSGILMEDALCLPAGICLPFFPNSRLLWGLSPHSLRGDPGHCSTLPPRFAGSGNQGSGQGSGNPRFREPGFEQGSGNNGFWLASGFRDVWVPGRQGSGIPRFSDKVPGTLGCRTMASSSQSLDCAKVLESPEHQF